MSCFFISDLHLNPESPTITQGFLDFLAGPASACQALYILGDLFDAWIGDDDDNAFVLTVKQHLKHFSQSHALYVLPGNRDFLLGEQFAEETGARLLPDVYTAPIGDQTLLLMHGDLLCTQDVEYMQFRAMVHNPDWQKQVLKLPLPQRRQMAADLRSKSRSMSAVKAEDIMDVTPAEVLKVMHAAEVSVLIHGHTHRPAKHALVLTNGQAGQRWVLGDWGTYGWYLEASEKGLEQHRFALESSK